MTIYSETNQCFWNAEVCMVCYHCMFNRCDVLLVMQSYTIEGLVPSTDYSVSVAISNINGTGNFSEPVENCTCEGPDVDVVSVTPVCPSSLMVVWDVVLDPNGMLALTEEVSFVVRLQRSDGFVMDRTVNRTLMEIPCVSCYVPSDAGFYLRVNTFIHYTATIS